MNPYDLNRASVKTAKTVLILCGDSDLVTP